MKKLTMFILKKMRLQELAVLMLSRRGALRKSGWLRSFWNGAPVSADGSPIPWMTYGIIEFLDRKLQPHFRVLEFGSGNSTRWFALRVSHVTTVEHDSAFSAVLTCNRPSNVEILLRTPPEALGDYSSISFGSPTDMNSYVGVLKEDLGSFDVVVVDGVFRNAVIRNLESVLDPKGVIVVDNTDYPDLDLSPLTKNGWKEVDFWGMQPLIGIPGKSSVFYRPNNCLFI